MNVKYLRMFGSNKSNKNVVDYLAIKVNVTNQDTPYYTIIYHPIKEDIFSKDNNLYICIY